ncbi:MAG: hypothetical protein ABJH08_08555 [Balneola sp.]
MEFGLGDYFAMLANDYICEGMDMTWQSPDGCLESEDYFAPLVKVTSE